MHTVSLIVIIFICVTPGAAASDEGLALLRPAARHGFLAPAPARRSPTEQVIKRQLEGWGGRNMKLVTVPGELQADPLTFSASSEQIWKGRTFSAAHAFDGDYRTAWVEDEPGPGLGAWLQFSFETGPTPPLLGVLLVNGFAKNPKMFRNNPRPQTARLTVVCDGGPSGPPFEMRYRLALWDRRSPQLFVVGPPHRVSLEGWCRVRVTLERVFAGSRFPDTSISELRVVFGRERRGS